MSDMKIAAMARQDSDEETIFLRIADGLDALCDGRGWDRTHNEAKRLADAAPEMLAALKELQALKELAETTPVADLLKALPLNRVKAAHEAANLAILKAEKGDE